ncbi:MAG: hypothetical protein ACYSRZ_02000 [Planctomycetota bacterium]|jgi:hypothetical protein
MTEFRRKILLWCLSLAVVFMVYAGYSRLNKTPQITTGSAEKSNKAAEANTTLDDEVGMVGKVGIGTVRNAKFITLNDQKQLKREFGFERLLHESGNQWILEKPYMNIFRDAFKIFITAEQGDIKLQSQSSTPTPEDAQLGGNVVIHILPARAGGVDESFIYLDEVVFSGEKSRFSSAGPVRFVSKNAELTGNSFELIYNQATERLELLRIVHLDSLKIKTSSKVSLLSGDNSDAQPETTKQQSVQKPQTPAESFTCVLSKNVVIETPEEVVFADVISIEDILPARSAKSRNQIAPAQQSDVSSPGTSSQTEQNESTDQLAEIIVTCDGGIVITSNNGRRSTQSSSAKDDMSMAEHKKIPQSFTYMPGRTTFVGQKLSYSVSTGRTVATGFSELTFYTDDMIDNKSKSDAVPVKITADRQINFSPASNRIMLAGNCTCTMLRTESDLQQRYKISAPRFTVNLSDSKTDKSLAYSARISHFTADKGLVKLETVKTAGQKQLGGIKLKCQRFDYDTVKQTFLATGPGLIALDNSNVTESEGTTDSFNFGRRYYGLVEDFDTLEYSLGSDRIIAEAGAKPIFIGYIPVTEDANSTRTTATAGHIELNLAETPQGRTALASLAAADGITYQQRDIQFAGSQLFYDANSSLITVTGSDQQPCYLNGSAVDEIEYDLKTGNIKAEIAGTGAL